MTCPHRYDAAAMVLNALPPQQRTRLHAHLAHCAGCSRTTSAAARRSPRTRVRSLTSRATSMPAPMAGPRSAWARAAASLPEATDIVVSTPSRRPCPGPGLLDDVGLVLWQDLGGHLVDTGVLERTGNPQDLLVRSPERGRRPAGASGRWSPSRSRQGRRCPRQVNSSTSGRDSVPHEPAPPRRGRHLRLALCPSSARGRLPTHHTGPDWRLQAHRLCGPHRTVEPVQ